MKEIIFLSILLIVFLIAIFIEYTRLQNRMTEKAQKDDENEVIDTIKDCVLKDQTDTVEDQETPVYCLDCLSAVTATLYTTDCDIADYEEGDVVQFEGDFIADGTDVISFEILSAPGIYNIPLNTPQVPGTRLFFNYDGTVVNGDFTWPEDSVVITFRVTYDCTLGGGEETAEFQLSNSFCSGGDDSRLDQLISQIQGEAPENNPNVVPCPE